MLKIGGNTLEEALKLLLNRCLVEGRIPASYGKMQNNNNYST